jgi:hypothetical protein
MPRTLLCSAVVCAVGLLAQAPPNAKKPDEVKPDAPKEKAFQEVIKGAREAGGLFRTYRTEDEKVFLEVLPEQFDKIFILALTCESGIGERGLYAAAMCGEVPVVFHRTGKQVQLIARNTAFTAQEGTAIRRAVDRSFSDSILGSTKLESQPHPDRKSVLIDLGAILLTDFPMFAYELEARFRIPYRFDAKNSASGIVCSSCHRRPDIGPGWPTIVWGTSTNNSKIIQLTGHTCRRGA